MFFFFFTVIMLCHEGSVANPIKFFFYFSVNIMLLTYNFDKLFKVLPTNLVNFLALETQVKSDEEKTFRDFFLIKKYNP